MNHATWIARGTAVLLLASCGGDDTNGGTVDAPGTHAVDAGRPDADPSVKAFPLKSIEQGLAYTAAITIGGTQTFDLDVDTGSTTVGVASTACASCQVSPKYTPGAGAVDQHKTTSATYGDQTGWNAEVFTDTVGLMGDAGSVSVRLGSMTSQNGFFRGNGDQGIIGFGGAAIATPNTDSFIDKRKAAGLSSDFAFEFCQDNGRLWLDGFDPAFTASDMQYTPLVSSAQLPFYSVTITSATIGGTNIGLSGTSIADTGTSVMIVSSTVDTKMLNAIKASPGFATTFPGGQLDDQKCLDGSGTTDAEVDAALPPMVVTMPGKAGAPITLSLPATRSYLFAQQGMYCFGAAVVDGLPTILGDTFLRAFVTDFDLPNNQIGFATEAGCTAPAAHFARPTELKPPHYYIRGRRAE